jgi:diguanylate cyclase (GGDEF)-like protein/PAS domain S-box-containing protein
VPPDVPEPAITRPLDADGQAAGAPATAASDTWDASDGRPPVDRTERSLRMGLRAALGAGAGLIGGALDALLFSAPGGALALGGWLGAGVTLALALRWGVVGAAAAWAGGLAAALALGPSAPHALLQASGAAAAVTGMVALLQRQGAGADLERARDVGLLVLAALFVAAPILAATAVAAPGGPAAGWLALLVAWPWQALGLLTVTVPLLAATRPSRRAVPEGPQGWLGPLAGTLAVLGAVLWFLGPRTGLATAVLLAWWPHVVLLALLVRGAFTVPALAVAAIVFVATGATAHGLGPFADFDRTEAGQALSGYAGSLLAVLLLLRAAAQELKLRERRARTAIAAAGLAVAEWHLQRAGEVHLSEDWRALTRRAERRGWTVAAWLDDVHEDDRERLQHALDAVAAGTLPAHHQELRVQSRDGWHWVDVNLRPSERDQAGRPLRLLATMTEVSERHEALERQRLSASLFEHLHEGLLIADADLRVLDANPAYSAILGVPLAELLGSVPSLLRPTPTDPLARQQRAAMWAGLRSHGRWRGELVEVRRNGESCTLQATISQVRGPEGDLRHHVLAISDITEQRMQRERLERQAHFDELTRLPNRARLTRLLAEAMHSAERDGTLLAVCYLDLDRFKQVNDAYGHEGGDRLLVELAGRLRGALRNREMWADAAARLGGDEFALLLRAGSMEEARMAIERVLRVVAAPFTLDPARDPVLITASIGATVYPIDHSDADTLLRHADHAMYGAKQSGRNGYHLFDPELRRATEERVVQIGRIQEALDRDEFVLHYQPIVDMRAGHVIGLEALLRWDHPERGLVLPMQFLPEIEVTGLIARIGDWVIGQALEHLAQWRRSGLDISVNVNIAARHLQEPDFVQRLSELLARHELPLADALKLEIVESAAHDDLEVTSGLLTRCRALGVRSALDDFGTGYSTLTHLQRLPVDVLKIDRSFVKHMLDDPQDRALVEGVIGLARTFGCAVVAEGVESPAQARKLLELGCDLGQGTGIGSAMPAAQVAAWVQGYRGMFALAPAAPRAGGAALDSTG